MDAFLGARHVDRMLLGEAIVPAAVPDPEEVGVFLKGACELRTSQGLDIDVAFGIGIILQFDLSVRRQGGSDKERDGDCSTEHEFLSWVRDDWIC